MRRKYLSLLLILPVLLSVSGCSGSGSIWANYREIKQLQLIQTIGLDTDAGSVRLSVSTGKATESAKTLRMSQSAPSIQLALDRLQDYATSASLFYAHTRYVVVGQAAAEAGVAPYLDFMERNTDMRLRAPLFIVADGTAEQAVLDTGGENADVTEALNALELDVRRQGNSRAFRCSEIAQALAGSGSALACAVICAQALEGQGEGGVILPHGYAILKDAKLVGFITEDTAMGVNLLLNAAGYGDVTLPDFGSGAVTVGFDSAGASFRPEWNDDGSLTRVDIHVSVRAAITELAEPQNITVPEFRNQLNQTLADTVRGWILDILAQSRTLGADFLGIGQKIALANPEKWEAIRAGWPSLLPEMEFSVSVNAVAERAFDLENSVGVTGGAS